MIIRSRAPLRLGLAGGGTDVSPYCDEFGGVVLNATIDMYSYCTIIPTDDNKIEILSSDMNQSCSCTSSLELSIDDNQVVLFKGVYNYIVKNYTKKPLSFKAWTYSDAPAGSGLGTSSTMVVAIIKCFVEWLKLPLGEYDIAKCAYIIEREDLGLRGGKQDQYAAAFGGFNFMEFKKDNVIINPLRVKKWVINELEDSLLLYFTGVSRESDKIISEQIKNTKEKDDKSVSALHELKESAYIMKEAILKADFEQFSNCLNKSWESKKKTNAIVSNVKIEDDYNFIMKNGGKSAKVSGAGGGGFMMIVCNPEQRYKLLHSLNNRGKAYTVKFTKEGCEGWVIY